MWTSSAFSSIVSVRRLAHVPALALLLAFGLSACGGGGADVPAAPDQAVSIRFTAVNGAVPVACGTRLEGIVSTGAQADLQDLRFYVTGLALVNDQGTAVPVQLDRNDWQFTQGAESVALIDLEDATGSCNTATATAATHAVVTGTVPAGRYVGLKARLGVPDTLNHSAISGGVAPLDIAAMAWSWQSGRKFVKIELNPVGGVTKPVAASDTAPATTTTVPTFNFHLGSTGCTAKTDAAGVVVKDPSGNTVYQCGNPNLVDFALPSFDAAIQQVALDVGQLFAGVDVTRETGGAAGCMSGATDPECPPFFTALQVTFGSGSTGLPIRGGAAQTVLRAVAK